jgi:hypothetical protein
VTKLWRTPRKQKHLEQNRRWVTGGVYMVLKTHIPSRKLADHKARLV